MAVPAISQASSIPIRPEIVLTGFEQAVRKMPFAAQTSFRGLDVAESERRLREVTDLAWQGCDDPEIASIVTSILSAEIRARAELGSRMASRSDVLANVINQELTTFRSMAVEMYPEAYESFVLALRDYVQRSTDNLSEQCWRYERALADLTGSPSAGFFSKYPVLVRLVAARIRFAGVNAAILLSRLAADAVQILDRFGIEIASLRDIVWGLSDAHWQGQMVAKLSFEQSVLYYKPRSVGSDRMFRSLIEALNVDLHQAVPAFLDCGNHGYAAETRQQPAQTADDVRRYFRRCGILTIVSYLAGLTDLHSENVVAAGDMPVVIDTETIADPVPECQEFAATREGGDFKAVQATLLRTGFLPIPMNAGSGHCDLSGLGGMGKQRSPVRGLFYSSEDDDARARYGALAARANTLTLHGAICHPADHLSALLEGVETTLLHVEGAAVASWVSRLMDDPPEIRWVARPTVLYEKIIEGMLHPALAADAQTADAFMLAKLVTHDTWGRRHLLPSERRQLWQCDIPAFTCSASDTIIRDRTGSAVVRLKASGLGALLERTENLPNSINAHLECVKLSIAADASTRRIPSTLASMTKATGISQQVELDLAGLVDRISDVALETSCGLRWTTLRPFEIGVYTVTLSDHSLYDGTAGIMLFSAAAAARLGNARALMLARALAQEFLASSGWMQGYGAGGYDGLPGIAYAMQCTAQYLEFDPAPFRFACASRIIDCVRLTEAMDLVSGIAGALLCASRMLRIGGLGDEERKAWIEIGETSARRLAENAFVSGEIATWMPIAPLKEWPHGLAHGGGGVAYALESWARAKGDTDAAKLARMAANYERRGYDEEAGGWRDTRNGRVVNYWCYGAPGLLLPFRLLAKGADGRQWEEMARICERGIVTADSSSDTICHGSAGNQELLGLSRLVEHEAYSVPKSIRSGLPMGVWNPGLMTGLSGIGMAALRGSLGRSVSSVLEMAL